MKNLKIALLILTGLFVLTLLVPAYILISYDDHDYQQLLIRSVNRFSDYTLSIEGPFKLHRSWSPTLSATQITLQSKSSNDNLTLQNFSITIDLRYLPRGTLLIKNLVLKNMNLDFSYNRPSHTNLITDIVQYLPTPVIEKAKLSYLRILLPQDNILDLNQLSIATNKAQSPLTIKGDALFKGENFSIQGLLGSFTESVKHRQPYPVQLKITGNLLTLTLAGNIEEIVSGDGLNLQLALNVQELAAFMDEGTPPLGHLSIQGHLSGSWKKPHISELQLALTRQKSVSVKVRGSIGDLLNQQEVDLQLSGFIHDPALLQWLLPEASPKVDTLIFKTTVIDDDQDIILNDIDIEASSATGIKVILQGRTRIANIHQPFQDLQLKAFLKSETTHAINPYLGNIFPELGTITGSATITHSQQGFMFNDIDILADHIQKVQLRARGKAGPFTIDQQKFGIALNLSLSANQTAELGALLNYNLPAMGPVQAEAKMIGSSEKISLSDIKLRAGSLDLAWFRANGEISWNHLDTDQPLQHTDISLFSSAPSIRDAFKLIDVTMPDLGPYVASLRMHGTGEIVTGSDLKIQTGTQNTLFIDIQGNIEQIFLTDFQQKGIDLTGTLTAKNVQQIARIFGHKNIPHLGLVKGTFSIQGDSKNLSIPNLSLTAGHKQDLYISAQGMIKSIPLNKQNTPQGIKINLSATAPSTAKLSIFADAETHIPDLGRLKIRGLLVNDRGSLAINNLHGTAGKPDKPLISLDGAIKNVLDWQGLEIRVSFNEQLLRRLFDLQQPKHLGSIQGELLLANNGNNIGIQHLKIESAGSDLLTLKIKGRIDDILNIDKINLNTDIVIHDLASAGRLFDEKLPELNEVKISGNFHGGKNKTRFKGDIDIGKTRLSNDLTFVFNQKVPHISGTISSHEINLFDLGFNDDNPSPGQPLFSNTPLLPKSLNKLNLDLKISTDKITGLIYPVDKTSINFSLNENKLKIKPARFILSGGQVELNATMDPGSESSVAVKGNDIILGSVRHDDNEPPIEGHLDLAIDLQGKGHSAHQIASSLQGEVAMLLENGKIQKQNLDLLFMNLISWVFSHGIADNEFIVSCGLIDYKIKNGIASGVLFMEGPRMTAKGKSTINLSTEKIDALINMEKKKLFLNQNIPIKLSGSLLDPEIEMVTLTQPILKAGGYIFFPTITIPIEVLNTLWDLVDKKQIEPGACYQRLSH